MQIKVSGKVLTIQIEYMIVNNTASFVKEMKYIYQILVQEEGLVRCVKIAIHQANSTTGSSTLKNLKNLAAIFVQLI